MNTKRDFAEFTERMRRLMRGKTGTESRVPASFYVATLTCSKFGISETPPGDLGHHLNEAASLVAVVAMIGAKYLLAKYAFRCAASLKPRYV